RPSPDVETRSVSERTFEDTESAMAASPADSHSTAKSAPPRVCLYRSGGSSRGLKTVDIHHPGIAIHLNRHRYAENRETTGVRHGGPHFNAYSGRQQRLVPHRQPWGFDKSILIVRLVIRETAVCQVLRQHI